MRTNRASLFARMVQDIKVLNANTDSEELQSLIDAALRTVRVERRARKQATILPPFPNPLN